MICTKCYNEYSWWDEKCPCCGAQTIKFGRGLRVWFGRLISTKPPQPRNARPQFALKRLLVCLTLISIGVGLFILVRFRRESQFIYEWTTWIILSSWATIGAGFGSLHRRLAVGVVIGAISGVIVIGIIYMLLLVWAFSHIKPAPKSMPTVTYHAGQIDPPANESAVQRR